MKKSLNVYRFPAAVLVLGAVCLGLRQGLYAAALDERNLLLRGHPLTAVLWAVVFLSAALVLLRVRKLDGSARYEDNFAPSPAGAYGSFLLAGGIGLTVLTNTPGMAGTLGLLWQVLGLLAVPLLLWAGICRLRGKVPSFLIHGELCLFLLIHVMNQYQRWCGDPQLMDYVFALFGALTLSFFAYYTAAFGAGCGKRRMQLGAGLLAVLFCTAALSVDEYPFLYLGGIVFALTNLCSLQPQPGEEAPAHDPS